MRRVLGRRTLAVACAIAVIGALAAAGSAAAQDCVIVHRSAQGTAHASSINWAVVSVSDIVQSCYLDASPGQIDAANAAVSAAGLPTVFTTRTNKVLPDNGHGIVHIDNELFGAIVGAIGPPTNLANCG